MLMILRTLENCWGSCFRRELRGFVGQFVTASWARDFVAGRAGFSEPRSIPSFFMRLRSVLGCRSRIFAAPRSPSITQSVFCRTLWICRLSTCYSDEESLVASCEEKGFRSATSSVDAIAALAAGSRSAPNLKTGPRDNTTARSTTFCNSRMFPGQS